MTNTERKERKKKAQKFYLDILLKKIRRRLSDVVFTWHCGHAVFSLRYFNQHSSQLICQQASDTHGFTHDSY